jgi:transmembrane sensor
MNHEADTPENEAQVAAVIRRALPRDPDPAARERARAAVEAEWRAALAERRSAARAQPSSRPRRFAIAAGLVAAGAAGIFGWLASQDAGPRPQVAQLERGAVTVDGLRLESGAGIEAGDTVAAAGSGALLRLGPALSVRLAAGTEATLAAASRIELRGGRLFVDALPGAGAELAVDTSQGEVSHLGTQYEVLERDGVVEVAVREGRIRLALAEGATAEASAGESVTVSRGQAPLRQAIADPQARFAWIASLPAPVVIDGRLLAEFLAWYARETGRSIAFADAKLERQAASTRLSGTVDGLAPEAALEVVAASTDLVVRRSPGVMLVERRSAR